MKPKICRNCEIEIVCNEKIGNPRACREAEKLINDLGIDSAAAALKVARMGVFNENN